MSKGSVKMRERATACRMHVGLLGPACKRLRPLALAIVVLVAPGCGKQAQRSPSAGTQARVTGVPLPEWAPENLSPEFLRAARVIESDPPEFYDKPGEPDPAVRAYWARFTHWLPTAWELFGRLTDKQMEQFLTAREVRIPIRSMTEKQRAILDRLFEDYRQAMSGVPEIEDWLVHLYKLGAQEDLSNVDVLFWNRASGLAVMVFRVPHPSGEALHSPARLGLVRSRESEASE
jgi:hypothetical protein